MVLRYLDISSDEKSVRTHTGLRRDEFEALAEKSGQEWDGHMRCFTWEGKPRRRHSKGRRNSVLATAEDKLLFLLYFLKLNPLQEVLATAFGMDQPQASRWLEVLRARLIAALEKERVLPERKSERLYRLLEHEERILIDATERSVGRSVDEETQKEYYSGKKSHTIKNVVLANSSKKILYLSQAHEGSVHDKKIADEAEIEFEKMIGLLQDSGFQGFCPPKAPLAMPEKKPRGKELTQEQKQHNKQKAAQRVVVEHTIGGIKKWRIVKDKIRSYRHKLRDEVIPIACGLHTLL